MEKQKRELKVKEVRELGQSIDVLFTDGSVADVQIKFEDIKSEGAEKIIKKYEHESWFDEKIEGKIRDKAEQLGAKEGKGASPKKDDGSVPATGGGEMKASGEDKGGDAQQPGEENKWGAGQDVGHASKEENKQAQ